MLVTEERQEVAEFDDLEDEFDADEYDVASKPSRKSIWQRIWRFFFKTSSVREAEYRERMIELSKAIENFPDAAVNYILRGELHSQHQEYDEAREDFNKALELAEAQYENERWGISAQAIRDRALKGLQRIIGR